MLHSFGTYDWFIDFTEDGGVEKQNCCETELLLDMPCLTQVTEKLKKREDILWYN